MGRFTNSDRWHWAWRFAIKLPPEARQPHVQRRSLAQLFERPLEGLSKTKLMFRCWHLFEREPFEPMRSELPEATPLPGAADVVRQWRWQLREQFDVADEFQRDEVLRLFPEEMLVDLLNAADNDSAAATQRDVFDYSVGQVRRLREWLEPYREMLTARSQAARQCATADLSRAYYRCPPEDRSEGASPPVEPRLMQRFTVTEAQYAVFDCRSGGVRDRASDQPAIGVNWFDAWMFSRWLGRTFRLPTADESESACRAGSNTEFWWGPQFDATRCNARESNIGRTLGRRETLKGYQNIYGLFHTAVSAREHRWKCGRLRDGRFSGARPRWRGRRPFASTWARGACVPYYKSLTRPGTANCPHGAILSSDQVTQRIVLPQI